MKNKLFISLLYGITSLSFAQGNFLEKGTSGTGVFLSYAKSQAVDAGMAAVGYSFSGITDLQFGLGVEERFTGFLGLNFFPVKQDTIHIPLAVGLNFGYNWVSINGKLVDIFSAGGGVSRVFHFDAFAVQLLFQVGYIFSPTSSKTFTSYGGSLAFIFDVSPDLIVVAGPEISTAEKISAIGLGLGFIFPSEKSLRQ